MLSRACNRVAIGVFEHSLASAGARKHGMFARC